MMCVISSDLAGAERCDTPALSREAFPGLHSAVAYPRAADDDDDDDDNDDDDGKQDCCRPIFIEDSPEAARVQANRYSCLSIPYTSNGLCLGHRLPPPPPPPPAAPSLPGRDNMFNP